MRYEWDTEKDRKNRLKHGISFELAALVFEDDLCFVYPDWMDETGEQRFHALGAVLENEAGPSVLLVVHTYREYRHGEEIIRIISAREASPRERRIYLDQAAD